MLFCRKQIVALLCCDTLKVDNFGIGRPFHPIEEEFLNECGNVLSEILDANNKYVAKQHNTPEVIEKHTDNVVEIKLARQEQLEQERLDEIKRKKAKKIAVAQKKFEVAHKAWQERQEAKAALKEKQEKAKQARIAAGKEVLLGVCMNDSTTNLIDFRGLLNRPRIG